MIARHRRRMALSGAVVPLGSGRDDDESYCYSVYSILQ